MDASTFAHIQARRALLGDKYTFVTIPEAERISGRSKSNLYRIAADGKLPLIKRGRRTTRLRLSDLLKLDEEAA